MAPRLEELYPALGAAYSAGDLEAVLALYDARAVFVIKPGRVTDGPVELRAALAHALARGGRLTVAPETFVRSDDVILVLGSFTLSGRDRAPRDRTARFADVLRRQPDGGWLVAVDNPFGGA